MLSIERRRGRENMRHDNRPTKKQKRLHSDHSTSVRNLEYGSLLSRKAISNGASFFKYTIASVMASAPSASKTLAIEVRRSPPFCEVVGDTPCFSMATEIILRSSSLSPASSAPHVDVMDWSRSRASFAKPGSVYVCVCVRGTTRMIC